MKSRSELGEKAHSQPRRFWDNFMENLTIHILRPQQGPGVRHEALGTIRT